MHSLRPNEELLRPAALKTDFAVRPRTRPPVRCSARVSNREWRGGRRSTMRSGSLRLWRWRRARQNGHDVGWGLTFGTILTVRRRGASRERSPILGILRSLLPFASLASLPSRPETAPFAFVPRQGPSL